MPTLVERDFGRHRARRVRGCGRGRRPGRSRPHRPAHRRGVSRRLPRARTTAPWRCSSPTAQAPASSSRVSPDGAQGARVRGYAGSTTRSWAAACRWRSVPQTGAETVADPMVAKAAALTVPPGAASDYTELMRLIIEDELLLNPEDIVWLDRWSRCRQVYRIDPAVASELMDQPVEGDLPCEGAAPTSRTRSCTSRRRCARTTACGGAPPTVFLAWLDVPLEDPHGPEQLMVCYIYRDRKRVLAPVPLTGGTLADVAAKVADDSSRASERILEQSGGEVGGEVLGGRGHALRHRPGREPTAVYHQRRGRRGGRVPTAVRAARAEGRQAHQPRDPPAGRRRHGPPPIGAARTLAGGGGQSSSTGRTVAPHVRRAHWQHYWTGKRKGREDGNAQGNKEGEDKADGRGREASRR